MGLIEQAARRLEELRRAGIEVSENAERSGGIHAVKPRASPPPAAEFPRAPDVVLDLAKLAAEGYVTPDAPRSLVADEFRVIKRPLIANASAEGSAQIKNGNLIMVTSAVPGEGKSFTAINLAMSIAMEIDRVVLLVDADVARPSLPRRLGLPDTPGLLDALGESSANLGQVLRHTNVERLTFLSSGKQHERATEMLASGAMTGLLDELAARYSDRIVVFDSPPLLVTTEARVLATHMGQIVFVVHAGSTRRSEVKQALATIEACQIKLMVLNGARTASQGAYGYGYGYGR
jgi:exopolysaccharide/PEP-CTERM locus tyrosine autokinase